LPLLFSLSLCNLWAGQSFVSLLVEEDIHSLPALNKAVGLDLGLTVSASKIAQCGKKPPDVPKNFLIPLLPKNGSQMRKSIR
jgi:hypothetical protein